MKTAKFVPCPQGIDDLLDQEEPGVLQPYRVVKTIELEAADYEDFISDMLAERLFLASAAWLCGVGESMWCIKVKQKGCVDGVLIVPHNECFIGWAAYCSEK